MLNRLILIQRLYHVELIFLFFLQGMKLSKLYRTVFKPSSQSTAAIILQIFILVSCVSCTCTNGNECSFSFVQCKHAPISAFKLWSLALLIACHSTFNISWGILPDLSRLRPCAKEIRYISFIKLFVILGCVKKPLDELWNINFNPVSYNDSCDGANFFLENSHLQ